MENYYTSYATANSLSRWLQVDPLADKYPGWNPYNYCVNNPLRFVDPDGKDTLTFHHNGNYLRSSPGGQHVGHILDDKGNFKRSISFLDPKDMISIQSTANPDPNKWVPNGDGFIIKGIDLSFDNTLVERAFKGVVPILGVFGPRAELTKIIYATLASFPNGPMDFVHHQNKVLNDKLAVIGSMAYNNFDAGNFTWGIAMSILGYSPADAQQAGRIYERVIKWRPDHITDQTAIWNGANYLKVK